MKNLNPTFKRHFENPCNAGELKHYNASGKDSSLESEILITFTSVIKKNIITDIKFRAFGCSVSTASTTVRRDFDASAFTRQ